MNKKEWSVLVGLCGVLVVVLVAGEIHMKAVRQQQHNAALKYQANHPNGPSDQTVSSNTNIQSKEVTVGTLNTVDYLNAVEKQSGAARVVAIGSSGTKGIGVTDPTQDWFSLLVGKLKEQPWLHKLKAYDLGIYGATTSSLLTGTAIDQAISDRPNLILLETCSLTDWYQNIPEKTSLSDLNQIVSKLQARLPGTRIVLYSPNPIQDSTNKAGYTYADYLINEKAMIKANGWDFVDVHASMASAVSKGTFTLNDLLADPYHPNALGYKLWEQAMWSGLEHDSRGGANQSTG